MGIDIINYVTGIGNGSRAHVDTVCFVTNRQCCARLQKKGIAKEKDFSAILVNFGGIRGAERIVGAYIHWG